MFREFKAILLPLLLCISCSSAFLGKNVPPSPASIAKTKQPIKPADLTEIQQKQNNQIMIDGYRSLDMVSSTDSEIFTENKVVAGAQTIQYELSPPQFIYVVLTSIFITCLLIADVIGVKLFEIPLPFEILGHKTVEHTCGMLTFPITFMLGDTINEYFGSKATKQTVYIGLAMSVLTFLVMNIAQAMPFLDKPFNVTPEAFNMIFGSAKLMYIASVLAYFVGQMTDIWLFGIIKKLTKGQLLWLRATGSTVISQLLDSFVVSYIAFSLGKSLTGQTPATLDEIYSIAATGYGLKFAMSVALTPALYLLRDVMENRFGLKGIPADQE